MYKHISEFLPKYCLYDKSEKGIQLFDTKEAVLDYLETVYWYDYDADTVDGNYPTLADYHKSMTLDEALEFYKEDWELTLIQNENTKTS